MGADAAATATRISPADDLLADARVGLGLVEKDDGTLAEIVAKTLPAAVAELTELLGADRDEWAWAGPRSSGTRRETRCVRARECPI